MKNKNQILLLFDFFFVIIYMKVCIKVIYMGNIGNLMLLLDATCESVLGEKMINLLQDLFTWIKIVVPLLVLTLIIIDMVKAVLAGNEDQMKKAQSAAIKRLIIGVALFFLPNLVNLILEIAGLYGTCGIG